MIHMNLKNTYSIKAFKEAKKYLPGGVNSPVRAFKSIGGVPVFMKKGKGANIWDIDDNRYIDYCLSWGSLILGHANKGVINRAKKAINNGSSFGCPTLAETELAKLISSAIPSLEKVRFVNSGTEAVMSAIRLARAYTGRNTIVKFDGCYHGHSDSLLVSAGSGVAHSPEASSLGVPAELVKHTISIPFNNTEILGEYFSRHGKDVAAIILEIVPANMGLILPDKQFLDLIRDLAKQFNSLIIADEVITGFRFSEGSAQQHYGFEPHITTLGKIIGGGFPVGAYGGKKEIMSLIAPEGNVYQAGTLSGNPVAMHAGIASISKLLEPVSFKKLDKLTQLMVTEMKIVEEKYNICFHSAGPMFTIFLSGRHIRNFEDVRNNIDEKRFSGFYKKLLKQKIYMSPSLYETNFLSTAHTLKDIEITCEAIEKALK
jgi:glutamate-1-semialdehyde 2,1-aminomutase